MSSRVIAEFKSVGFRYSSADRWAVRELSFQVVPGEVLGLVGPNGSGKTTIYRLLLGFIRPETGHVSVAGGSPADYRVRNGIGYLPEQVRLPGEVRVREFAALMARLAGLAAGNGGSIVEQQMESLDLLDRSSRAIGSLSHGYKQRVGLLAALLGDPQLLLLDEPANGLDPASVGILRSVIRALRRRGCAVIVSSHNLAELERVCDGLLILREGSMVGRCTRGSLSRPDVWVVRWRASGQLRPPERRALLARLGGVQLAADEIGFREGRAAREFAHRLTVAGGVVEAIVRRRFDMEFLYHSVLQKSSPETVSNDDRDR